jgi:hypothetical protein
MNHPSKNRFGDLIAAQFGILSIPTARAQVLIYVGNFGRNAAQPMASTMLKA